MTNEFYSPIEGALYEVVDYINWNSIIYNRAKNVFIGDFIIWISTDERKFFHLREMCMCEVVIGKTISPSLGLDFLLKDRIKLVSKP